MELRKRALGVSLGLTVGLAFMLGTWFIMIAGAKGEVFSKMSVFCRGYTVSWGGSILGLLWGFLYGFIAGVIIAYFYNFVNKSISKS
jgi:hypothetical protein